MALMNETTTIVDLRTDPRAWALWDRWRELVVVMAELCGPDVPAPLETLLVRLGQSRNSGRPDTYWECEVDKWRVLIRSLTERGLNPKQPICVYICVQADETEVFKFIKGTHRACILLALGRAVPAVCEGRIAVDRELAVLTEEHPLSKYPLTEDEE